MESITGPIEGESIGLNSEDMKKKMSDYYGEYFESVKTSYSEALHNALEEANSEDTLNSFMEQYMPDVSNIDFIGPYSQAIYDQLSTLDLSKADMEALKTSLSDGVATAIEGADMDKVNAALDIVKGNVETSASTKFGAGYNVTMPLTVTFDYSVLYVPEFVVQHHTKETRRRRLCIRRSTVVMAGRGGLGRVHHSYKSEPQGRRT